MFFAALATGDLNKAKDAIEKVRAAQGDTPVVENLEGLLKLAQLDIDGAAAKFRDILQKHPEFVPAQINLARVWPRCRASRRTPSRSYQAFSTKPVSQTCLTMLASQLAQTTA